MNAIEARAETDKNAKPLELRTAEFFASAMKEIHADIAAKSRDGLDFTTIYIWEGSGIFHHIVAQLQSEQYIIGPINVIEGTRVRRYNLGGVQW